MRAHTTLIAIGMAALYLAPAGAAVPARFSYQGQLTDAGGAPISTPTTVRFTILWGGTASENPSTGTTVYQEDTVLVPDAMGVFHHLIGSGSPTTQCDEDRNGTPAELCALAPNDFISTAPIYLELRVDPGGVNNLLDPRQQLVSVPYAMNAATINGLPPYTDTEALAAILAADGPGSGFNADFLDGFSYEELITGVNASNGLTGGGAGGTVSLGIAAGGVTQSMLAANSVGSAQIQNNAVGTSELALFAVTAAQIADDAVGFSQIAAGAVGSSEISDGAVGSAEIATDAVTVAEIATNSVGSAEIIDGAVNGTDILNSTVTGADIANSTVTGANIADDTITAAKLSLLPVISLDLLTTSTTESTRSLGAQLFCSLAKVHVTGPNGPTPDHMCSVTYAAPNWTLRARSNGNTLVFCQAVCF